MPVPFRQIDIFWWYKTVLNQEKYVKGVTYFSESFGALFLGYDSESLSLIAVKHIEKGNDHTKIHERKAFIQTTDK